MANKHEIGTTFLGEAFKAWYHSPDAAQFTRERRAHLYGIWNDLEDDTTEKLRAWAAAGFPE